MINEKREKVPTRITSVTNHTTNYVLPTQDGDPRKSQPMATDHFMERLGESDKEEGGRAEKESLTLGNIPRRTYYIFRGTWIRIGGCCVEGCLGH